MLYMNNLLLYLDKILYGYVDKSLFILSFICVTAAICVVVSKNPIISVLFLIGLFLAIACYLILAGLNFIGLSYLLVYVGAVSILFLFILMLINIRVSELVNNTGNVIPLALVIGLTFIYFMYDILPNNNIMQGDIFNQDWNKSIVDNFVDHNPQYYLNNMYFVSSKSWDSCIVETTHIASLGYIMYTTYFIWLLITSIILLLAMVGAIIITIKQTQ